MSTEDATQDATGENTGAPAPRSDAPRHRRDPSSAAPTPVPAAPADAPAAAPDLATTAITPATPIVTATAITPATPIVTATATTPASTSRVKVPLAIWTATALHLGVMVIFTLLYPAYWGFDETGHVSRVLAAQNGNITPTPGAEPYVGGVNNSYQMYTVHEQPPFITYKPPPRDARPSFIALGGAEAHPPPGQLPNQLAQHPPGYYVLAAGVLDVVPGAASLAWDQTVGLLRLLDVVFLLPLPYLCWAIVRRFSRPRIAVAAAFAPILLPALERLGGSVNNDDLLILLTSIFMLQIGKVLTGDLRRRVAVAMGVSLTLALLTKGFALVLPPVAVLAYVVAWQRARRARGLFPWPQVAIVVVAGAIGGLWWLRNLVVYNTVQPPGLTKAQANQVWPPLPPGSKPEHVGTYLHHVLDRMTTDAWGALGLTVPPSLPGAITLIASVVAVALMLLAFVSCIAGRRNAGAVPSGAGPVQQAPRASTVDLGLLLLPTVLVVVPLLYHGWSDYSRTGQLIGIQGRYLYPDFVGLVAIAAVGGEFVGSAAPKWVERLLPLLACVLAIGIEVTAFYVVLTKMWLTNGTLLNGNASRLARAIGADSPWPGSVTIAILGFTALSGLVAVVGLLVGLRGRETTGTSTQFPVPG
jgi:4-amino-4-deoxy-L-arabinose transferase-like glycosyltransferase